MEIGCKRIFASEQKGKRVVKGKSIYFVHCLQDVIITQRCQLHLFYGINICALVCNWDFRFYVEQLCLFFQHRRLFPCLCNCPSVHVVHIV